MDSSSGGGRGGRGPPRGPRSMMAGRTGFVKASGEGNRLADGECIGADVCWDWIRSDRR